MRRSDNRLFVEKMRQLTRERVAAGHALPARVAEQWFSPSELAAILSLSESSVRRRIADGTIAAMKIGGAVRVHASELARLRTAAPTSPRLRLVRGGKR